MRPSAVPAQVHVFLIADVRGYTRFTLERGDEAAARLASRFATVIEETVTPRDGVVLELRGDEALVVFSSPRQAVRAAVEVQARFEEEITRDPTLPLRVGIGLDAGEAVPVGTGFRGAALNLAARLCSLAGAGEVLVSEGVTHLVRKIEGLDYVDRGPAQLKGFADPVRVLQVVANEPRTAISTPDSEPPFSTLAPQRLPLGGFLGSLPSGPLVGRRAELRRTRTAVDAVAAGEGRLMLLGGEPGAGKTRLAQEVTVLVRKGGFTVAAGRCYEPEQSVPYYPFADVLVTLYALVPPQLKAEAARRWPYLSLLLPDQLGDPPSSSGAPDEQQRVFWAATGFLQTLAGFAPLALMLDDLHWADSASLKLLLHLARHTRNIPLLLLGTYRDVEVDRQHPLEDAMRDLTREGLLERIAVDRLDEAETRALIAETMGQEEVSAEFTRLVHSRTDGNPFFVQQLLHVLVEQGDLYRAGGHWQRRDLTDLVVPESVRSVIGRRVARLREETQVVLQEASVLGQSFAFDDLLVMSRRNEETLDTTLEEATRAGLLRVSTGERYAFDHALTQGMLYAELSPRRRRRFHLAAGEALEALPAKHRRRRVAELAWHFQQAGDERALAYAILAGDAAEAVYAHEEAEAQYRLALDLARERDDEATEADLLVKLGRVLGNLGHYDEALEVMDAALRLYPGLDNTAGEMRALAGIGQIHARRGSVREGLGRLLPIAEREGESAPSAELAAIHLALAELYMRSGRYHEIEVVAARAAELARVVGDDRLLAGAEVRRTSAGALIGGADSLPAQEKALDLAQRVDDPWWTGIAVANLSASYWIIGDFKRHVEYRRLALELAERQGNPVHIAHAMALLALADTFYGEMVEAHRLAQQALEMILPFDTVSVAAYVHHALAFRSIIQGDLEHTGSHLEQALAIGQRSNDLQAIMLSLDAWTRLGALTGQWEDVIPVMEQYLGQCKNFGYFCTWVSSLLAHAALYRGNTDRAAELIRQGLVPGAETFFWTRMHVLLIQGVILARHRNWKDAEASFCEVLAMAEAAPCPLIQAQAQCEWGRVLVHRGTIEEAKERLEAARAIYRDLAAPLYLRQIEECLAAL